MPETILNMPETNILGPHTREWAVTGTICPPLAAHYIRSVGISEIGRGYCMIRHNPIFSHVNASLEGEGRSWSNDHWAPFPGGTVGVFPKGVPHGAYWAGKRWRMCWVTYVEPPKKQPLIGGTRIRFTQADVRPIEWALMGFYHEFNRDNDPQVIAHHVELIHTAAQRLVQQDNTPGRLAQLWEKVDADPAHAWTAAELAEAVHMSEVHLRRLTMAELGRTPLQQVAWLRVRRAAYLLESHSHTVEAAAWDVGYRSTSAFTTAFKRWLGRPPRS